MGKTSYQKNIKKTRQMNKNKKKRLSKKYIEKTLQMNKNKNMEKLKKINIIT